MGETLVVESTWEQHTSIVVVAAHFGLLPTHNLDEYPLHINKKNSPERKHCFFSNKCVTDLLVFSQANKVPQATEVSFTACEVAVELRKNENETRNEVEITDRNTHVHTQHSTGVMSLASCVNANKWRCWRCAGDWQQEAGEWWQEGEDCHTERR